MKLEYLKVKFQKYVFFGGATAIFLETLISTSVLVLFNFCGVSPPAKIL